MSVRSKKSLGREQSPETEYQREKRARLSSDDEEERRASKLSPNGMRSPSFGSNHNKPAELFRKDLISAMKLADSDPLQPEEYFQIADPWRQEWEKGVQVPVNPGSIPEIHVRVLREKSKTGDFKILRNSRKLLHAAADETYRQGMHELTGMQQLAEQVVRYDLDDIDVCWLTQVNEEREEMGESMIDEWIMERIIEELENQSHESMQKTIKTEEGLGIEYDEDVICDVCRSPDSEENNEMVFCDGCDICVHQACYGIQTIPEGSWLCRPCSLGVKPVCILCPNVDGAMKSTRSGMKWAHVSCSLWIPEVSIGCVEKMEPITKISQIPPSRWALVCCLCKERIGACIQCSVKTCKTAFHVTCAFKNNLEMRTILESEEEGGVKLKAYCPKHSKKRERCQSDSETDSPRKEQLLCGRKELSIEEKANLRESRLAQLEEDFYSLVNVKEVSNNLNIAPDIVDIVFVYWKLKRKANFDRPLLTPKQDEASLLEKQQEDSLAARMKMFVHLRQDLERVRNLCYMVSRREKIKRQYYRIKESVFHAQVELLTDENLPMSPREIEKILKKYQDDSIYNEFLFQDRVPDTTILSDWGISRAGYEEFVKRHLTFGFGSKHSVFGVQQRPIVSKGYVRKKARKNVSSDNQCEKSPRYNIKKLIPRKNKENNQCDESACSDDEIPVEIHRKRRLPKKVKKSRKNSESILRGTNSTLEENENRHSVDCINKSMTHTSSMDTATQQKVSDRKMMKIKLLDKSLPQNSEHLDDSFSKDYSSSLRVKEEEEEHEEDENEDKSNVIVDNSKKKNRIFALKKRKKSAQKLKQEGSQTDELAGQESDEEIHHYSVSPLKPNGHIPESVKAELNGLLIKSKLLVDEKLRENMQMKLLHSKKVQSLMNGLKRTPQQSIYLRLSKNSRKLSPSLSENCLTIESKDDSMMNRISSDIYETCVQGNWYNKHTSPHSGITSFKISKNGSTTSDKPLPLAGGGLLHTEDSGKNIRKLSCSRSSADRRVRRKLDSDLGSCTVNDTLSDSSAALRDNSKSQVSIVNSVDNYKDMSRAVLQSRLSVYDDDSENIDHGICIDSVNRLSDIPRRITRSHTTDWNDEDVSDQKQSQKHISKGKTNELAKMSYVLSAS